MAKNEWYKENDFKIVLKDYLIKKHNSYHIKDINNLPPEIEISKDRDNLKEMKINNMEIFYPCGFNADGRIMYICKCFCGTYFIAGHKNLTSGTTKSCDCLRNKRVIETNRSRTEEIIGKKFGKLQVLNFSGYQEKANKKRVSLYKCKCDCGRECIKQGIYLRQGDTKSCGLCGMNSAGEAAIANFLDERKVEYSSQYFFEDCLSEKGYYLYFDFALFKDDKLICLIEYDGEQHYVNDNRLNVFFGNFEERHRRDLIKDKYCEDNSITLFRIRFDENVKEKMEDVINELYSK